MRDTERLFHQWMESFVERPSEFTAGMPVCPYAREARLKRDIEFSGYSSVADLGTVLVDACEGFSQDQKMRVIALTAAARPDAQATVDLVKRLRESYFRKNVWLLYDHPDLREPMGGQKTFNHGELTLFFVQSLSSLVEASKHLHTKGYYKGWDAEYYDSVVGSREEYYNRMIDQT